MAISIYTHSDLIKETLGKLTLVKKFVINGTMRFIIKPFKILRKFLTGFENVEIPASSCCKSNYNFRFLSYHWFIRRRVPEESKNANKMGQYFS